MGWLFNALMVRELMKKQDIEPVGESETEYQTPKGTIKIFDGENKAYLAFLDYAQSNNDPFFPRVIEVSDALQTSDLKNSKIVKFELLTQMPDDHYKPDFYINMNKCCSIINKYHNTKELDSNDSQFLKEMAKTYKTEANRIVGLVNSVRTKGILFPTNITQQSFMMRDRQVVLVNPLADKDLI